MTLRIKKSLLKRYYTELAFGKDWLACSNKYLEMSKQRQ